MKTYFTIKAFILFAVVSLCVKQEAFSQLCEWQLTNQTYNATDPDAAGPATGSVTFTLQLHTVSGSIPNVTLITLGFSFQSANAMVPTAVGCGNVSSPSNIFVSPEFTTAGYTYSSVVQCNNFPQIAGGQNFDRTASGSLDGTVGAGVTLTTAWKDVFTVTLWTLGSSFPQGGYAMINSCSGGAPGQLGSYIINDGVGNEFIANSITYGTPLALGGALPVLFSKFDAKCTNTGTLISWSTAQESNTSRFEIERSSNGTIWTNIGTVPAAGSSSTDRNYQQLDLAGGIALYRIKQIDKDGQFIYTGIERTNCQVKNITSVIYPVPATDVLNVVIKSDRAVKTQLMVYEVSGKLVRKVDASVLNGNNNFIINLKGLSAGDYILRTNDPTLEINKVFTIAR
jgi:hypothetical protein